MDQSLLKVLRKKSLLVVVDIPSLLLGCPLIEGVYCAMPCKIWINKKRQVKLYPIPPFFAHPFFLFLALSIPPLPSQFSSPKFPLSGTSDLLFLVEKRQPAEAGFWGRFWTGSPHRKKRKILFFSGARKKVSYIAIGGSQCWATKPHNSERKSSKRLGWNETPGSLQYPKFDYRQTFCLRAINANYR